MSKVYRSISLALGCALMTGSAVLTTGCAVGTTRLTVSHEQLSSVQPKRQGDVLVRPFVDKREHTEYIGNKRNMYGMVLGHVATQKGVKIEELMTQYFVEALQAAGYNATLDKAASGSPAPQAKCDTIIDGEIVVFWMDLYMTVWHRVEVKVRAINPADQTVVWEKLIEGDENATLWAGVTAEFERVVRLAITKALNHAAREFASDDFYNKAIRKQP